MEGTKNKTISLLSDELQSNRKRKGKAKAKSSKSVHLSQEEYTEMRRNMDKLAKIEQLLVAKGVNIHNAYSRA